jgi:hypothetical protein
MSDSRSVSFDEFTELLRRSDKLSDADIRVTSCPQSPSDEVLKITSNLTLTFDSSLDFSCRNILITDCEVEIHDLSLLGTISVRDSTVTLVNSRLRNPPAGCDYILDIADHSKVYARCSSFGDTSRFGLCVDDHSLLSLDGCSVLNVELFGVALTGSSVGTFTDSIFMDGNHDLLYADTSSSLSLTKCSVKRAKRLGISVGLMCSLTMTESTIDHCESGCLGATHAERVIVYNCHFLDSPHSAVLLENTTAMIKHSVIANCHGNAINANRSTKLIASHCTLRNTTYPPLAICDGALGYIKKCTIRDSEMSGIIVRNRSRAAIKKCTVERAKQVGIVVSDSREVSIASTFVFNCQEAALSCYNHSEVHVTSSYFVGPSRVGINVFTGGFVYATDTTIAGMHNMAVWLHHGGSGRFVSALIHTAVSETKEALVEQIRAIPLLDCSTDVPDDRLFRIETPRAVVATGCFVVGRGVMDIVRTDSDEDLERGMSAIPAKCKVCGAPAVDCYFSVCAHSIYCRKCWDALESKPLRCELCFMPIERVVTPIDASHDDEKTCGICLTEKTDAIVVPCGHLICGDCGQSWFEQHSECPYCRQPGAKCRPFVSYT